MSGADKLLKISRMSWPEIGTRIAQRFRIVRERVALRRNGAAITARRWIEALDPAQISDLRLRRAVGSHDVLAAADAMQDYLRRRETPRFYFAPGELESIVSNYREMFPGRVTEVVEEADKQLEHRLKIFQFDEVACGKKVPWRSDIVHSKSSGLEHWSKIQYLDFSAVGDSKIVWEPNRHQHLVTLSLAQLLSGSERYGEECVAQLDDWDHENPELCGINWASSLELGFRIWSWVWTTHFLLWANPFTGEQLGRSLQRIQRHASFIHQNLSTYFSPNTHLLGEGFALYVVGTVFPELEGAGKYRETGRTILIEEIRKQVRKDGSHAEQSDYYHRYATDFFLCAAILADRNDQPFPSFYRDSLERMCEFLMHTAWPDGTHPNIGDADGGRLVPFGRLVANDNRGVLSTAAVYFNRNDFRSRADDFHEETFWLLGPHSKLEFTSLTGCVPKESSKSFADSGRIVMRSDWNANARMLQFDAGPQGMDSCGHGHADALGVVCAADGVNWLVDPGTFVYTTSRQWRNHFRRTSAHNTVVVDGIGQAEPTDVFKWSDVCNAELRRWVSTPSLNFASATHEGYSRLSAPVTHTRSIVFCKPDYWFLLDEFTGTGSHDIDTLFHFPPEVELQIAGGVCRATSGAASFLISTHKDVALRTFRGIEEPTLAWYSDDYGRRVPSPTLAGRVRSQVPTRIPWILAPGEAAVQPEQAPGAKSQWTVLRANGADTLFFRGPGSVESPPDLETDAEFAWVRTDRNGDIQSAALVEGTRLVAPGGIRIFADRTLRHITVAKLETRAEIWMNPVAEIQLELSDVTTVTINGSDARFELEGSRLTMGESR